MNYFQASTVLHGVTLWVCLSICLCPESIIYNAGGGLTCCTVLCSFFVIKSDLRSAASRKVFISGSVGNH